MKTGALANWKPRGLVGPVAWNQPSGRGRVVCLNGGWREGAPGPGLVNDLIGWDDDWVTDWHSKSNRLPPLPNSRYGEWPQMSITVPSSGTDNRKD